MLGPKTLEAVKLMDQKELNNYLMVARIKMIGRIVVKRPNQLKDLNGWLNRACEFLR